ncbi:hypothetical protein D9758_008947 [Tetrapyrgos nigripes]|uniref:Uncharacterized protein n=1 Tax=Tetrapyrgos nigripes TaxID=182062 RepID=A0A8H5LRA4_9AGAR|nr:hypothetical protein D9758_008947 [Tetrapyrgos nigripes]
MSSSSSLGNKVRGAGHVIHGIGDNIRGTALGAADTVTNSREGESRNDVLARGGRDETAMGLDMMKDRAGNTIHTQEPLPSHEPYRSQGQDVGFGPSGATPDYRENTSFGNAAHGQGGGLTGETVRGSHPEHHRDDAVSNDPDAIRVGQRHLSHPMQRSRPDESTGTSNGTVQNGEGSFV